MPVAATAQTVWTGAAGDGAFTNPLNWTLGVPTSTVSATIATGTSILPTTVSLTGTGNVDNLTLAAFNTLDVLNTSGLQIALGATVANGGALNIQSTGNQTVLYLGDGSATTTLNGGGTVTLSDTSHSGEAFIYGDGGVTLDNVNNTISGEGQIGAGHQMNYINEAGALVDANVTGQTLELNVSGTVTNDNVLEATNGGTLLFSNQTVTNTGATIKASGSGSQVVIDNSTIHGGTLSGPVVANNGTVLDGTVSGGLAVNTLTISDGAQVTLAGAVSNTGTITLAGTGDQTLFYIGDGSTLVTTLTGGGSVVLSNTAHNGEDILLGDGAATLDNVNNTISGEGFIGDGHQMVYINEAGAVVDANVSGQTLTLDTGGETVTNKNILEATNGGILQFTNQTVNNEAGTITTDSGKGSSIVLNSTTLQGGVLSGPTTVNGSTTFDGQTLGALTTTKAVTVTDSSILNLAGTITNTGALTVASTGDQTELYLGDGGTLVTTLQGGGTVTLSDTSHKGEALILGDGGATLDNVNNTISGAGQIGVGHQMNLTNGASGVIDANVNGQALTIYLGGQTLTNNNLLEATNGATLQITGSQVTNTGETIRATGTGSQLGFQSATVSNSGGTVSAAGATNQITLNSSTIQGGLVTGTLTVQGASTLDGSTDGALTYNGAATVQDTASLTLLGTVTNGGSITLAGLGDQTALYLGDGGGPTTLTGGGTVTLTNSLHNGEDLIYGDGGVTLDNLNNTISGEGQIGAGHQMNYTNGASAVVDANVAGQTLEFNVGGTVTNNNLLEATNGGTLLFANQTVTNTGATIKASGTGSQVTLENTTVHGGTLSGPVVAIDGTVLDGTVSGGIAVNNLTISDGSAATLLGAVSNTGTITLAGTGDQTEFYVGDGSTLVTTLTGGGSVVLSNTAHNGEDILFGDGAATLDNVNNTISGEGFIGAGHQMVYINEASAVVDANVSGQTLTFETGGETVTNKNILEATNGGILQFTNQTVNNAAGTITTDSGKSSSIVLNSTILQGGVLSGPTTVNGTTTFDGQTLGALTTTKAVTVTDTSVLNLAGTITNSGALTVASTGDQTEIYLGDGSTLVTTLQGGGTVTLSDTSHKGEAIILGDGGATLDNVNNTISGEGQIGVGHQMNVINEIGGTILANSPGQTLTINNSGNLTNSGTLQVNAGSTLAATGTLTNFSGNTLTGGTYIVNGSSATGGTGTMQLNLPTNTGGEIVNNAATIVLNGPTANTLLQDINGNNALSALAANSTSGSSLTVEGGYTFTTAGSFANAGTIHAGSGGTFNASNGLTGTTGTLQIDSGGAASIAGGSTSSTTGTLTQNGTLALGSHNITVSTAYTNANFGVGNSFNNHADVTGSGLILAAANTAISVTGSAVSGGATPTLTFGSLHVGQAETLDYTITNTGTTGPSVLGAIQTTVNGGNITDSRLSGSGVTAGNYGPLGLGQSTTLAVTYTATTAGTLAPGQAIHVATNFDNVTTPTMGVTGGAAYNLASASLGTVDFGKVLVGSTEAQALSITNTAPAGAFSEGLDATLGAFSGMGSGQLSGSGSVTNLTAGSTDSTNLLVTLNATTAGTIDASVLVNLTSDGATTSHLGLTSLGTQSASITGIVNEKVIVGNLASASPATPNPVNLGNVRIGATSPVQFLTISNTATGPAEGLNASIGTSSPGLIAMGSFTSLAAGDTSSTDLSVAMNTTTAGLKNGSATITLASDGSFNSGVQTPLPSQTIAVTGAVYQTAQASALPSTINLGTVRTGTVVNTALSIANVAPNTGGYTETLGANFGPVSAGLSGSGSITGLGQGAPASTAMSVGFTAGSAGAFSGSAAVNFASEAIDGSGLGLYSLGSQTVNFTALVNALASLKLTETAGPSFDSTGVDSGTLNFGTVKQGGGPDEALLNLLNDVSGPADDLVGSIDPSALSTPFSFDGTSTFDLVAGAGIGFGITFNEDAATGFFSETLTIDEASHNAFQSDLALPEYVLTVEGTIKAPTSTVPDSGKTLLLLAFGLAAVAVVGSRRRRLPLAAHF